MPRGFLVKRYSNPLTTGCTSPNSQSFQHASNMPLPLTSRPLICRYSDEDRSDSSSSEQEAASTSNASPISLHRHAVHPLGPIGLSPPLLSFKERYRNEELPQEVPLALTKSNASPSHQNASTPSSISPNDNSNESPPALDLRCPGFIFHFSQRTTATPSSAPPSFQHHLSSLVNSCSPAIHSSAFTTSKKRHSLEPQQKSLKRHKVVRKLNFDEHKSSPVSGTFIRDSDSDDDFSTPSSCVRRSGDIDPSLNVVVITEEARAELAKIENKIGDYICALCKERYQDAFGLAQHRCTRIVHVEYRCPECDKVFNCPANLASHRRWHKPRNNSNGNESNVKTTKISVAGTVTIHPDADINECTSTISGDSSQQDDGQFECQNCHKRFRRQAYLKKHLVTQHNNSCENKPLHDDIKSAALNAKFGPDNQKVIDYSTQMGKSSYKNALNEDEFSKCPFCDISLPNKLSLEIHAKSIHSNEIYSCKNCSSIFYTPSHLIKHINKFHSSENDQSLIVQSLDPIST